MTQVVSRSDRMGPSETDRASPPPRPAALDDLGRNLLSQFPGPIRHFVDPLMKAIVAQELSPDSYTAVAGALLAEFSTGDDFASLARLLRVSGLLAAAEIAFQAAAAMDLEDSSLKDVWGGPFNGQKHRQNMFKELVKSLDVTAIIETGTFRGSTTAFMAETSGLPVFTCERNERFFHYAKLRLAAQKEVRLYCEDSRAFLREIFAADMLPPGPLFCYLDAHWDEDLPLWDEIDIILGHRSNAVVMVDDFRVPGDPGFHYDDYGRGKCLSVQELRAHVASDMDLFFPHLSSAAETGEKRGVVVLAQRELADRIARTVLSLERVEWRQAICLDAVLNQLAAAEAKAEAQRAELLGVAEAKAEAQRAELLRLREEFQGKLSELQRSRWRKLGLYLGIAKKASFED